MASSSATRMRVFGAAAWVGRGSGGGGGGEGSVNFSNPSLEGLEGSSGVFIVLTLRLGFELLRQLAGVARAKDSQGALGSVRRTQQFPGILPIDRRADAFHERRSAFVEKRDDAVHERFVVVEFREEFFA